MKIRFIYGELPFWRAEVGRIALFIGNIDFDDVRISHEEFSQVKTIGKLFDGTIIPFRQLPCLNIDGRSICQTGGIARFCGKLGGLYPKSDLINSVLIDQVIDMATDINILLGPSGKEEDLNRKKSLREELASFAIPRKLSFLEELLIENRSGWFVSNKMTIADIAIWRLMGWLTSGMLDYMPIDLLKPFSEINRVCLSVETHPKVKEWVQKTYPKNYKSGSFE